MLLFLPNDSRYIRPFFRGLSFAFVALFAPSGYADEPSTENRALAEIIFREAKALADKEQFEQACPKFQESHRLDPKPGTILNLAVCHEKQGKIASAWLDYLEAATIAGRAGQKDREAFAKDQAAKLEKMLPRLVVSVPVKTPGLVIKVDSAVLSDAAWGIAAPINPGDHSLEATAPGYKAFSKTVTIEAKPGNVDVTVPQLEQEAVVQPKDPPPSNGSASNGVTTHDTPPLGQEKPKPDVRPLVPNTPPFNKPLWIGVAVGGVGLAGMIVGSVLGVRTFSLRDEGNAECRPDPERTYCTKKGIELHGQAASSATGSTVGFVVGGLGLGAGAVLILLGMRQVPQPASRAWILPHVERTGGGILMGLSF